MRAEPTPPGFTLVEVLVALAILAITLAAGMRAAGALAGNAQRLADVTAAQWCADNLFTNLRLSRQFPGLGESDSRCTQLGVDYTVRLKVQGTPNPNFRRIDAQVQDSAGQTVLLLSTVLGRR